MFSRRTVWNLAPNRLTLAHDEVLRAHKAIMDLTISNPTRCGFDYDMQAILSSLSQPQSLHYDPQPKGLLSAREAVAQYYAVRCESDIPVRPGEVNDANQKSGSPDPNSIVLTTSTSEGYSFLFRLLANPGEEVLVPKPSYPLFDFLADLQDVRLVGYPLIYDHGWQIDFASLERTITAKSRAIVVVHPNNPTGSYVSAAERGQLNALCARHELALIADEVFLDYSTGAPNGGQFSFVANNQALTFTLSGLSKVSGLPQMKLAWIVVSGPEQLVSAALQRLEIIADTYLSLNAPVQFAAGTLLKQRHSIQPLLMARIRVNLTELDRQLAAQKSCSRLDVEGGWNVVLRVPATRSDEDLAIELLRSCSVLVHPGHFYDFPHDGYLVLSLITPVAEFREGISRLLAFVSQCTTSS